MLLLFFGENVMKIKFKKYDQNGSSTAELLIIRKQSEKPLPSGRGYSYIVL